MKSVFLTAAIAAFGLGAAIPQQESAPAAPTAQRQDLPTQIVPRTYEQQASALDASSNSLPGIVEPIRDAVMAIPITGMLMQLEVTEGKVVKADTLLGVVDNRVAAANQKVAQFNAESTAIIDVANVELKVAQSEYARFANVSDRRAIAAVEIDRAKANVERAEVGVRQAVEQHERLQHELALQTAQLETLNLRAPFAGRVLSVDVQKGQTVPVGTPVLRIADLSTLKVQLFIDVAHFDQMHIGDTYELQAGSPVNGTISTKLTAFEPVINAATNTFRCTFEIKNPDERMPAGFKVTFVGHRESTTD